MGIYTIIITALKEMHRFLWHSRNNVANTILRNKKFISTLKCKTNNCLANYDVWDKIFVSSFWFLFSSWSCYGAPGLKPNIGFYWVTVGGPEEYQRWITRLYGKFNIVCLASAKKLDNKISVKQKGKDFINQPNAVSIALCITLWNVQASPWLNPIMMSSRDILIIRLSPLISK